MRWKDARGRQRSAERGGLGEAIQRHGAERFLLTAGGWRAKEGAARERALWRWLVVKAEVSKQEQQDSGVFKRNGHNGSFL